VNTTPIGMYPHGDRSPISEEIMGKIKPSAIAYDLIYTPSPTKFLQLAQAKGAIIIDGLEMLVQQGAAALEIWGRQPISAEVTQIMMRSLQKKLFG
ncbi:MAG: shikimate dehydrogenase, partial [Cyanobacteria bacterium J06642_3]